MAKEEKAEKGIVHVAPGETLARIEQGKEHAILRTNAPVREVMLPDGTVIRVREDTAMVDGGFVSPTAGTTIIGTIVGIQQIPSQYSREGLPPRAQEVILIQGTAFTAVPPNFPGATRIFNNQAFVDVSGLLRLGVTSALEPIKRTAKAGDRIQLICLGALPPRPGSDRRPRINWQSFREMPAGAPHEEEPE